MNKKIIFFGFFLISILGGFFLPLALHGKNESVGEEPKNEFVAVDENAKAKEVEAVEAEPEEEAEVREGGNCTEKYGYLMLINPNFTVSTGWINERRNGLVSISKTYGIIEGHRGNGDNLLDAEAAKHMNDMVNAYKEYNVGHTLETRSCYRARGTSCGRLCYATGTSDHHTGFTCDLLDPQYGTELDTSDLAKHKEWQWLKQNSYKYGFIDRFPVEWAGGSMAEPVNVDANGTTGLYETWHYRYVGVKVATEIATGKYNNGKYDSLEHYLKMTGKVSDLKNGKC